MVVFIVSLRKPGNNGNIYALILDLVLILREKKYLNLFLSAFRVQIYDQIQ